MTTQIANVARLLGSMADIHLTGAESPDGHVSGKITGVDGTGVSIMEMADGAPVSTEQFFPWTSIDRIVKH